MTQPTQTRETVVQDAAAVGALVEALAGALAQALGPETDVALVGVRRGGVALAKRLRKALDARGRHGDLGTVDIALYRDDAHLALPRPEAGPTEILFPIDGRQVVVVDDVFWTGRTARAALDAVLDFGRPKRLWLVTLVVRPGRELPIVPDLSALPLAPAAGEKIELRLVEDGHPEDALVLVRRGGR
jgi:pyrimidine operon attenuation protein/uracil phosphoribosyltransferase